MIIKQQIVHRAVRSVDLVCPRCGVDRLGTIMTPVKYAGIGSIRLIACGTLDNVVVCDTCDHESSLAVLEVPTARQLGVMLEDGWTAAAVLVLRSCDEVSDRTISETATMLHEAGVFVDQVRLRQTISALQPAEATRRVRRLAPEMTDFGKQGFLYRLASILPDAAALTPAQQDALADVGRQLRMPASHIADVVEIAEVA